MKHVLAWVGRGFSATHAKHIWSPGFQPQEIGGRGARTITLIGHGSVCSHVASNEVNRSRYILSGVFVEHTHVCAHVYTLSTKCSCIHSFGASSRHTSQVVFKQFPDRSIMFGKSKS